MDILDKIEQRLNSNEPGQIFNFTRDEIKNIVQNIYKNEKLAKQYYTLYEIGNLILVEMEINSLLTLAMDKIIEITQARRGFIAIIDEEQNPDFKVARHLEKGDIEKPAFQVSKSIMKHVASTAETICLQDAMADPRFSNENSVRSLKLLSVLCLPIYHQNRVTGIIYVDNPAERHSFSGDIVDLLTKFSHQIAIALKNATAFSDLKHEKSQLLNALRLNYRFEEIIGSGPLMTNILDKIAKVADTDATVLITGETGVGKELIAKALHYNSNRSEKPFIAVHCGAITETLIEDDLFGHVKGSYTGAYTSKRGKFEIADGGTIFLDEIGEMKPAMQVKLLRILQNGTFTPVGGEKEKHCDVRVVAATNRNLKAMIADNTFRKDLYYRLNVIQIDIPPLRERREDILPLAAYFLRKYDKKGGTLSLSNPVRQILLEYDYHGNIRELENIIESAVALCTGQSIEIEHIQEKLLFINTYIDSEATFQKRKQQFMNEWESNEIKKLLVLTKGKVREAARVAKMDLSSLSGKLKLYNIRYEDYK